MEADRDQPCPLSLAHELLTPTCRPRFLVEADRDQPCLLSLAHELLRLTCRPRSLVEADSPGPACRRRPRAGATSTQLQTPWRQPPPSTHMRRPCRCWCTIRQAFAISSYCIHDLGSLVMHLSSVQQFRDESGLAATDSHLGLPLQLLLLTFRHLFSTRQSFCARPYMHHFTPRAVHAAAVSVSPKLLLMWAARG